MSNSNHKILNQIEARLIQAQSMTKIVLDNHNYKDSGYDEPFIDHCDMGNLLWTSSDLINLALDELGNIDFSEGKRHG